MRRNVSFWTVALVVAYALLTFAGCAGLMQDPLMHLEAVTLATVPAQIAMPSGPASALPKTQARLMIAASRINASVTYAPLEHGAYGRTDHDTRAIIINEALNADVRTTTLAHELAHLLQPPGLDKESHEIWADAVAYLVVRPERDRIKDTAYYLAFYKGRLDVLRIYRKEILFAAALLRGEIE